MRAPRKVRLGSVAGLLMGVVLLTSGCGANDNPELRPPDTADAEATVLEVVGEDLRFDREELRVPAGEPFTVRFDNRDDGIGHNFAVYESGPPARGEVAMTSIEAGPTVQTLEVDGLEAGEYFYQCDNHPTTMTGTLVVE